MYRNYILIPTLLFLALAASACAGLNRNLTISQTESESIYDRVIADGKVRVGVRFDNPPLSFIEENGNWVGFDVDLANALARQLGVEIEMVKVDETTRISFLQEGKIDMAVASMNHTRQREDAVDFSLTYFWDNQSFLVRTGTYSTLEEMIGKKVAANAGSSAILAWQTYVTLKGSPEAEIVEFTDKLAAVQALRDGVVDGYTEDNITLLALAGGDLNLTLIPGGFNPVQFGIGIPENNSRWRDQINYALQDLWKNGVYQEIYDKWFTGPDAIIPLPLSGEMEIWPD